MGLLGSGNSLAWLQASPNHSPSFHLPSTKARSTHGILCAVLVTAVHRGVRAGQDRELGFLSLRGGSVSNCCIAYHTSLLGEGGFPLFSAYA